MKTVIRFLTLRNAFDDAGIPYDIDAREGFWKSDLCVLIQAMAGWMLNPDDAISMTTVLTSAFCQFSDEELAKMKVGHKTLVQGVREAHPELFEAFARLRQTADKDGIPALIKTRQTLTFCARRSMQSSLSACMTSW